jgi:hypothetical protein
MKNIFLLLIFFSFGCESSKNNPPINLPPPPPPPPPFFHKDFNPPLHAPNFIPDIREVYEIQINPIPHPFSVSGNLAVWVNKRRVSLDYHQSKYLSNLLNLPSNFNKNTAEIHRGSGWHKAFNSNELE